MGQDMNSVLPFLFILIFTLNQNTFPPKKQNDEENYDHEENDEENDKHEENDEENDANE